MASEFASFDTGGAESSKPAPEGNGCRIANDKGVKGDRG